MFLLIYLFIINIAAYILMAEDKRRAKHNEWRIRESTLFAVALIGGGAGSWAGMYTFRHKTKHMQFVIGMPLITIVQVWLLFNYLHITL